MLDHQLRLFLSFHEGIDDALLVEPNNLAELCNRSVFHKFVGKPETREAWRKSVVVHPFEHGTAHATGTYAVFDGDDFGEFLSHLAEQVGIEGF